MRILLIEDDELLGSGVQNGLKLFGHIVDWIKDGLSATRAIRDGRFDAIILDIGLPTLDGYSVLKKMRGQNIKTPVLILTARETIEERVKGLDLGADDYLVKPFDLDELCARLRALQRRSNERAIPIITHKAITLDPASHVVTYQDKAINISRREFALLEQLLENAGRVLSREHLAQILYGWEEDVDSNALEVHIHNLRKKFGPELIRTIRGVGYIIEKEK